MKNPVWLDDEVIRLLQATSISRFGGREGAIDHCMLASALGRPQKQFELNQTQNLADLAASYAFEIVMARPFADGNRRASLLACSLFLQSNGMTFLAAPAETIAAVMALAAGELSQQGFAAWLQNNVL